MPQISAAEFNTLPLRVHSFLAGVPLHDAWAIHLPRPQGPVTLADFNPMERHDRGQLPGTVRALFNVRFFLGRIFGLEAEPKAAGTTSFAARLTPEDRARSSVEPGTPSGLFRVVYRFENELLLELHNRTAHAAAVSALAGTPEGYRFYFGVYVAKESWITPLYMGLIDPFRRWMVYPALMKSIRANWLTFVSSRNNEMNA